MKKNGTLQAALAKARQDVEDKKAAAHEAEAIVASARRALDEAIAQVVKAQLAIDDEMPQCRMVSVSWRTGKPCNEGVVMVIMRKTAGGMLVVRERGNDGAQQHKFKFAPHSGLYREHGKANSGSYYTRQLHDVPKDFLPN